MLNLQQNNIFAEYLIALVNKIQIHTKHKFLQKVLL